MDIRFARPTEVEEIAALWVDAFPGRRTVPDRIAMLESGGRYGGLDTVLVAKGRDGRLAGACKIYRMTQHLSGAALPMMGLAAVAVAPHARRQGLGASLCVAAMEEARSRGDVLSTLYPFRPDYYERLGWGLVGHLLKHRFRTESLPEYEEARSVRAARLPDDLDGIRSCYDRMAAQSNGPVARDRRIWAYRLSGEELGVRPVEVSDVLEGRAPGRNRIVVHDRGGITGYALLRHSLSRPPESAAIHVRELVWEDEEGYRGLLGHLAAQRDQWPLGLHFAHPDERFEDRLLEPRPPGYTSSRSLYFPTAVRVRGPMLRILDLRTALRSRPLRGPAGTTFRVSVADARIPANSGPWKVAVGEVGAGAVVESSDGREPVAAELSADAATFARILAGEITPTAAARIGRAAVKGDAGTLDTAFAAAPFRLLDEF